MKVMRLTLMAGIAVLFCCAAAAADSKSMPPVKIGALMPLTGEYAMMAAAFREGLELAQDEINAAGGIKGSPLLVVVEDTRNEAKSASSAAQKLVSADKVVAGITTSYPETEVGGAHFQKSGIPSLALWDSSPDIDQMGDYIFAIGPWTPSDAQVGAEFCLNHLKAKRAVVLNTNDVWSALVSDLFEKEFKDRGGEILERYNVNPGDADFRTIIAKIGKHNPDVIYAPLASEIIPFHQQLKTARNSKPVISVGVISDEHVAQDPRALEGVYQSQISDPERPETKLLAETYRKKFGRDLKLTWYVATGYDAVKLYAHVMQAVGPDSKQIKDYLYTVRNFPGAAQCISITPGGSSPYYVKMFQIRSGVFVRLN